MPCKRALWIRSRLKPLSETSCDMFPRASSPALTAHHRYEERTERRRFVEWSMLIWCFALAANRGSLKAQTKESVCLCACVRPVRSGGRSGSGCWSGALAFFYTWPESLWYNLVCTPGLFLGALV